MHRVVAPAAGSPGYSQARLSVVFFTGPLLDAPIATLPGVGRSCSDIDRGSAKYDTVVTEEYLLMKINPTAAE